MINPFRFYFKRIAFLFASAAMLLAFDQSVSAQEARLRSQLLPTCAGTVNSRFADVFADGNIAVLGSYSCRGAFIFDVSNPDAPVLSSWYNPGNNQQFLEAVVIGSRAYFGSGNGGGVHIVDLTNPANPQLLGIVNATSGNGFASIHEMVVLRQNGADYLIENFNGFSTKVLKVINVSNPANPVFVRDINPTEVSWVHAMHIRGSRMFTSGWGTGSVRGRTEIYDIANINTQAPTLLGYIEDSTSVTGGNSMHSSWSSEDGNYLYSCRETNSGNADLRTYDISNPAQPVLVNRLGMNDLGLNAVSPHNPVVMGNYLYVAWYQAGLQIFDIRNPAAPRRVGQYDTYLPAFTEDKTAKETTTGEPWDLFCGGEKSRNALPTSYDGNWAVYPFLGQDKIILGDLRSGLLIVDATAKNAVADFDGDDKTDFSTYAPASGLWQIENSSNSNLTSTYFGTNGDRIVPGDYDGDGKSDIAVFRPANGFWYILGSQSGFRAQQFGANGDVPLAADFDADGKTDVAVWRPSTGNWHVSRSNFGLLTVQFGAVGDIPMIGDFESDGQADFVVYRPSNGVWYVRQSSTGLMIARQFGLSTDKPVSGDFDGDGRTDFAVFRPSDRVWYILNSAANSISAYQFGNADDALVPADYDGDGKADIAVYRPSTGVWYRLNSSNNQFVSRAFGQNGDVPAPSSVQPQ